MKSYTYYNELINDFTWGNNKILIEEDINLLKNTEFDHNGYSNIIFDDYKWKDPNRPSDTDSPELGINCFVNAYADFYDVIFVFYQV